MTHPDSIETGREESLVEPLDVTGSDHRRALRFVETEDGLLGVERRECRRVDVGKRVLISTEDAFDFLMGFEANV